MTRSARIYIAGHRGLVGSAIVRALEKAGYGNLLLRRSDELDLTDQAATRAFFAEKRPEYVFLAAAKVGGIHANNTYPADFIAVNLRIQSNVIEAAYRYGVKRLLFLGSSCIYPRSAPQPMKEEHLLTGPLELTNEPYALAKIAGIKMCESFNRQYGTRFVSVMPTNLYGPGDNFSLENSHVLPAMIRKFHEAKMAAKGAHSTDVSADRRPTTANAHPRVVLWGTGAPMREFLHVDDMASACLFVMNLPDDVLDRHFRNYPEPSFVNVGTGTDVTIRELAETVREVVGFEGEIVWDRTKPDGTPRKLLDVSRLESLGWKAEIPLRDGIKSTYRWFLDHADTIRR